MLQTMMKQMLMPQKPLYGLRLISPVSLLLITALACHNTAEAQVQMQSLSVLRDTISTDVTVHQKGIVNNVLDVNVTSNGMDRMAQLSAVRVRGTTSIIGGNDPLVIIDGVTSDIATLSTIYPADIESLAVLKNASETALYGSRGASGVFMPMMEATTPISLMPSLARALCRTISWPLVAELKSRIIVPRLVISTTIPLLKIKIIPIWWPRLMSPSMLLTTV